MEGSVALGPLRVSQTAAVSCVGCCFGMAALHSEDFLTLCFEAIALVGRQQFRCR